MKLKERTILITGGTSGIGFEMTKQLIALRNTVVITGRDERKLEEVHALLPAVHTFRSDASKPQEIEVLRRLVLVDFPACDTLINNAGIMRNLNLNEQRGASNVTQELDVNLSGPVQMVQEFLPHLKSRPNALIVNVSSGLAFVPFPLSPIYSAAKAGIHAYTRCLRVQLKGSNVAVVELAPPGVETKLFRGEFADAMKGQKGMAVDLLVEKAIAGIEAGKTEIRPGLSNVLYIQPPRSRAPISTDGENGEDRSLIQPEANKLVQRKRLLGSNPNVTEGTRKVRKSRKASAVRVPRVCCELYFGAVRSSDAG